MEQEKNRGENTSLFDNFKNIFQVMRGTTKEMNDALGREQPAGKKTKAEILASFKEKHSGISIEMVLKANEMLMKGVKSDLCDCFKVKLTAKEMNAVFKRTNEQLAKDPVRQAQEAARQKQMDEFIKNCSKKSPE